MGHYVQGMFATLLATPCSAPFLGTAVAFALGADVLTLFATFTALALGMALPWILVTALFGANMLGLFEIRLSSGTNTWLASKGDNSLVGHYVQGMFATLLATPCSAPFLGTPLTTVEKPSSTVVV